MRERSPGTNGPHNDEKTPVIVVKKIRDLILDETFKPGDWLPESELGERFGVSRSPVREAKVFPEPATRPRQREALIELYRKGKVDEALRAFKKVYLEATHQIIAHLQDLEAVDAGH